MTQEKYNTGRRKFQHLTKEKRAQIEILLRHGLPKTQIAKTVAISCSTLYLELARGTVQQMNSELRVYHKYFWDVGQRVYEQNRKNSRPPLKLEGNFDEIVCTKTLYNYIDQGLLRVRNIDLPLRVKCKAKSGRVRKNRQIYGASIEERPLAVDSREEFGHWEIDTVLGCPGSSEVLLTLDERMTRKRHIVKIAARTTEAVAEGLERIRAQYGDQWSVVFRTITSDNGSEFADLPKLFSDTKIYYTILTRTVLGNGARTKSKTF